MPSEVGEKAAPQPKPTFGQGSALSSCAVARWILGPPPTEKLSASFAAKTGAMSMTARLLLVESYRPIQPLSYLLASPNGALTPRPSQYFPSSVMGDAA